MPALLTDETALYEGMWAGVPVYGEMAPGERYLPIFLDVMTEHAPGRLSLGNPTVLDAGTGSGKGALALQRHDFRVTACDLTDAGLTDEARAAVRFKPACLWHDLRPLAPLWQSFDWVYCTDVLEHIPPQFTMLVVTRLLEVARAGVFLSIAFEPDTYGMWMGRHLHQTVQPFVWWRDSLRELGTVLDARDLHQAGTFLVRGR